MESRKDNGPLWGIEDANIRPLRTIESLKMPARLGNFVNFVDFVVCDKVVVLLSLGADYCDKHVRVIYPRKRKVVLDKYFEILIIRHFKPRRQNPGLPDNENKESLKTRLPPQVRLSRSITITPGS